MTNLTGVGPLQTRANVTPITRSFPLSQRNGAFRGPATPTLIFS
jgi:hypothetical protein